MTDRHGAFAWYELLTTDPHAAREFYGKVVGWQAQDDTSAGFPYATFTAEGTEVGGMMQLPPDARRAGASPHWVGYVAVDDIGARVERLRQLGGSVFLPPTDSNIGRVAIVADPQTAKFGIVGGLKRGSRQDSSAFSGQACWHELFAADGPKAIGFYRDLFGWLAAEPQKDQLESYHLVSSGSRVFGGIFTKLPRAPVPFWLYYFEVPNISVAVARVKENGGRIVQGPVKLAEEGWIVRCIDPQGAMFSLQGKTSDDNVENAPVGELNWAVDWGGFASRGKVVRPKS